MKKKSFMEWFFGKSYQPQGKEFWTRFWKKKAVEIGKAFMWAVISVIAYFILFWYPSTQFMEDGDITKIKFFQKVDTGKRIFSSSNFIPTHTLACSFPVTGNSLRDDSVYERVVTEIQGHSNCTNLHDVQALINSENMLDEPIIKYINRKVVLESFSEYSQSQPVMAMRLFVIMPRTCPLDEYDNYNLKVFEIHFLVLGLYGALIGIFFLVRLWLMSNYNKLARKRKYE